jgi:hypothetical protein
MHEPDAIIVGNHARTRRVSQWIRVRFSDLFLPDPNPQSATVSRPTI